MKEKRVLEDERRQFKRFKVKQKSAFVVTSYGPTLGEVIDISEGGLAFTYVGDEKWPTALSEGCMVFGNHDSCLDIPMKIVSDQEFGAEGVANEPTIRRRCLEFDNLSKEQRFLLECFIWINGVVEC